MHDARAAEPTRRTGGGWDPDRYARFHDHRLRPALELLDRVPLTSPSLVYDLGCGAGTITRIIAERFAGARVVGLDSSPEMLAKARTDPGRIEWVGADITEWEPEQAPDLIYSNAVLHWLEDHPALFPRLLGYLAPGGCLAVQMPLSHLQPSHVLMCELANGGWAARGSVTKPWRPPPRASGLIPGPTRLLPRGRQSSTSGRPIPPRLEGRTASRMGRATGSGGLNG